MKPALKLKTKGMLSIAILSTLLLGGLAALETAQSQGRFGQMGMRSAERFDRFDGNGEGIITQAEVDAIQKERFERFDADGNGLMSLEEYEPLWQELNRSRMVDRFQRFDDDGNGGIALEEFERRSSNFVVRLDENNDGEVTVNEMASSRRGMRGRSRR